MFFLGGALPEVVIAGDQLGYCWCHNLPAGQHVGLTGWLWLSRAGCPVTKAFFWFCFTDRISSAVTLDLKRTCSSSKWRFSSKEIGLVAENVWSNWGLHFRDKVLIPKKVLVLGENSSLKSMFQSREKVLVQREVFPPKRSLGRFWSHKKVVVPNSINPNLTSLSPSVPAPQVHRPDTSQGTEN